MIKNQKLVSRLVFMVMPSLEKDLKTEAKEKGFKLSRYLRLIIYNRHLIVDTEEFKKDSNFKW